MSTGDHPGSVWRVMIGLGARAEEAFEDGYLSLYARAYQVAYQLLGSRGDAEDVAQDALTRALARWNRLRNPEAWVATVAANLAIDVGRRRARARQEPTKPAPGVDDSEVSCLRLRLQGALAALPRRQRQVVVLRYLVDRSEAEVARMLGMSPGSVKQHASRGCRRLREVLDQAGGAEKEDIRVRTSD